MASPRDSAGHINLCDARRVLGLLLREDSWVVHRLVGEEDAKRIIVVVDRTAQMSANSTRQRVAMSTFYETVDTTNEME